MGVSIFTDAGSNLFASLLEREHSAIRVLPMPLQIGGREYLCYDSSLDPEEFSRGFYSAMREGSEARTSLPSPGLLEEMAREEIKRGNQIVFVSMSSGISGSFQSASLVAETLNSEVGRTAMAVIDSKTAGFGEGMVALYAEKVAKGQSSFEMTMKMTEEYVQRVRSEFTVDSLKYLARTGRISKLNAALGNALMIKPILHGSEEGKIVVIGKTIGRKNAIRKLVSLCAENIVDRDAKVYIAHCDAAQDAREIASGLQEHGIENVEISFYDLITGAHVGPGALAVFYEGRDRSVKKGFLPGLAKKPSKS